MKNTKKLNIKATISEAWQLTSGVKGKYWLVLFPVAAIIVANEILQFFFRNSGLIQLLLFYTTWLLLLPFVARVFQLAIVRSQHAEIRLRELSFYFNRIPSLCWAQIIIIIFAILAMAPFLLIIRLPAMILSMTLVLYIAIGSIMYIPLITVGDLKAWQAIKISFKRINQNIPQVVGLFLISLGIFFVSMLPFFIGIIWLFPIQPSLKTIVGIIWSVPMQSSLKTIVGGIIPFFISMIWSVPMVYNILGIIYRELFIPNDSINTEESLIASVISDDIQIAFDGQG